MNVVSKKPIKVLNNESREYVILEVGNKYVFNMSKPTTIKDKKNNGRIVEVLGFTDNFMGDVIVRYLDNNRQGKLNIGYLLPCECKSVNRE